MLSPGTEVGSYRVVEHVGAEGTMAEVYRAVDESGRTVAVKVLDGSVWQAHREAAAVPHLDYPGIVRTYEVIEQRGRLCLIQEWVEGQSLEAVLDSVGRLDVAETVRLGRSVAQALGYAHSRGILHRDIKPSNVLRTVDGDYKLVDFGALGLLLRETETTVDGEIAGTPLYMAPEQITGSPQSAATDLYGLGLLLFRSLYGTVPGASSGDFMELIVNRLNSAVTVPPSPLRGLLERLLATKAVDRPRSAAEVLAALSGLAPGESRPSTVPSGWPQQGSQTGYGQATVDTFPLTPPRGAVRAGRPGVVVLSAIAVVVGVLLVWLLAPSPADLGFWLRVGAGVVIVGVALVVARRVRRLAGRAPDAERQAASIITGAGGREALTRSMVLEVDQVVAKLKGLDAKFLGLTMVMLIREAEEAKEAADRVAALVQLVTLMEKLMRQLSPWYVRHKELIATGIAIVGSLVGVASVVSGFLR